MDKESSVIQLNRAGSAHGDGPDGHEQWRTVWAEHLASEDPHMSVRKIEEMARLTSPSPAPPTSAPALVYRVVARVLSMHIDDRAGRDCRKGMIDTSGYGSGPHPALDAFPAARDRVAHHKASDPWSRPEYRFWILLRGEQPVALFENTGFAYVDGPSLDLRKLYREHHRLFPVVAQALGSVLP